MANTYNVNSLDSPSDTKSREKIEKQTVNEKKGNTDLDKVQETNIERSFKEGLANNSDTEKSSPQQK